ncbi:MSC_0882 family membrane protein [Mycoplasma phocoenae]|uniref:Uncharacterized protein n=1 Tax=Mycoplasma phocoenae TaxID=754517 RepID=A0A858U6U8_9MOLU|nr:hypothetical protein [Mycoplasma phocoenae]QJG66953.1 hypothetical protein HGG69_01280 [Mycoplasma phocoenae]
MDIKPWNNNNNISNTKTVRVDIDQNINTKTFKSTKTETIDPKGIIPNGIYKVFKGQRSVKLFNIVIELVLLITGITFFTIFLTKPIWLNKEGHIPWFWYVVDIVGVLLVVWRLAIDSIELNGIIQTAKEYRNYIIRGETSTPAFITLLYRKIVMKQVLYNWLTIAYVFYFGLFIAIFWSLKEAQWWQSRGIDPETKEAIYFLDFKAWIAHSFPNPMIWIYVFISVLVIGIVLHVVISLIRRSRIATIENFVGSNVIDYNKIMEDKQKTNRFYAKIFFISILILLVIPFIVILMVKRILLSRKKG